MVVALEDWEVPFRPGLHDSISALEVALLAIEFSERVVMELFRKLREGLVLEGASHHAAHISVREGFSCLCEVGPDSIIVAPHDVLEWASL